MRFILLTLSGLGVLGGLSAQQPEMKTWSLDECVNYALENNLQVLTAAKQAAISENNLEASQWNYAPSLNANSNAGWNFGFNIDPVTNLPSQSRRFTSTLGLSSTWVPFEGGRKYNSIARQNHQYLAALYDLEDAKNDISLNVASAYLQILLNREILAVAQEQEKISSLQVERTQKLVEAGSAPKGDLLQLQAQLARDEQNTVNSENTLMISRLQLASLLQLSNPDDFRVNDPELEVPEAAVLVYPPSKVYETALENQPNIKAARERIMSSEEAVDISQGAYWPTLSLQGQIATNYSDQIREAGTVNETTVPIPTYVDPNDPDNSSIIFLPVDRSVPSDFQQKQFVDQVNDNMNSFIGFNLSIPIFNRMQTKNNVQSSRLQYELSQLQLKQEKNTMRQTIYQSHADAKASFNSYKAAEKSVEASTESFKYAKERYELGAINQYDFENAKNSLAVAQSEMIRAKFDYIFKVKVLEFYLTNQIKL